MPSPVLMMSFSPGSPAGERHHPRFWRCLWHTQKPDPGPGSSSPANLLAHPDGIFLTADDGVHGREWWWSDGTTAGTRLIADLTGDGQSSYPENFTICGEKLFFLAQTPGSGKELHVLD